MRFETLNMARALRQHRKGLSGLPNFDLTDPTGDDLCIVIAARGRTEVLERTLAAARRQTVTGHEIVVVLDGFDQPEPRAAAGTRVLTQRHAGPGAARNRGVDATEREPYLLETSVPGVFVAGDVRYNSVKRCASAVGEGSIAVQFMHQYLATL